MSKTMLIDATHEEETRVVVMDGKRLEEFDYESKFRKPMKSSIFLAKVTRVEPSLQAAFVNFGGNRHGFLPFSEIHPDYYRIPIADREALMAEQEAMIVEAEKQAEEEEAEDIKNAAKPGKKGDDENADDLGTNADDVSDMDDEDDLDAETGVQDAAADEAEDEPEEKAEKSKAKPRGRKKTAQKKVKENKDDKVVDDSGDDADDEKENIGNKKQPEPSEEEDDVEGNREGANVSANPLEDEGGGNARRRNSRGGRGGRNQGGRGGRDRNNNGGRGGRGRHQGGRGRGRSDEDFTPEQKFRQSLRNRYKIQEVVKRGQIMLVQVSKEERGNKGAAVSSYLSLPGRYCVLMPNSPRGGGVSRKIANYKDRARMRDVMKSLDVPKGMSVILRTAGVERTKAEIKRDLDYLTRLWSDIREQTMQSSAPSMIYEEANLIKRAVRDLYTRDVDEIVVAGEEGYQTAKNFMKMMIPSHVKKVKEYKDADRPLFNKYQVEGQIAEIGETEVTLPSGGYLVINPTEALVSVDVNSGKATKQRHIEETALHTNLEAAEEVGRQLRLRDLGGLVVIDFIDMEDRRNNGKVERKMRDALAGDKARVQVGRISSFGLMELSRQRLSPSLGESQFKPCSHCEGTGHVRTADAASIMVLRALEEEGMKGRAAQLIAHVAPEVAQYVLNHKRELLSSIEKRYNLTVLLRVDDEMANGKFRVEVSKPLDKSGESDDESDSGGVVEQKTDNREQGEGTGKRRRGRRGGRRRNNNAQREGGESSVETQDQGEKDSVKDGASDQDKKTDDKKPSGRGRKKTEDSSDEAVEKTSEKPVDDKADDKKPAKKAATKKPAAKAKKDDSDKDETASTAKVSNDDKPKTKAKSKAKVKADPEPPRDYEKVNEAPGEKKKGWWNRK